MRLEKEIIDMENFYATATIEEALAYFKAKSEQCKQAIIGSVERIKAIAASLIIKAGMGRFYKKEAGVAAALRSELTSAKVCLNTAIPSQRTIDILQALDDGIAMEEVLIEAIEIIKSNK